MHMADFAAVVRRYMTERRSMSLRVLAKAAHYDQGTLSKILNQQRPLTSYVAACPDEALDAGGETTAAAAKVAAFAEAARWRGRICPWTLLRGHCYTASYSATR
jgi:hypothetical protein